jgi:hypothetical protein
VIRDFLLNRDETGKEIMVFPETGKKYYIEWIGDGHSKWGDFDPVTKKFTGNYGQKNRGSVTPKESVITKENGFEEIWEGKGSAYEHVNIIHNRWKKDNGFG